MQVFLSLARYSQYAINVFENKNCRISKNIFKIKQVWHGIRNRKGTNNLKRIKIMAQTNNTFVTDFINTYKATSNINPMDYPASIIKLCDYILSNDKDNVDWNAAGDMFRCFNNENNTFLFHSFKNAAQSVTFFAKVFEIGFSEIMNDAYSTLIHRVETLKESCKELFA